MKFSRRAGGNLDCGGPGAEIDFILPDQCHNAVLLVKPEILACALDQETLDSLLVSRTIE